jgi:hypothetical protein
MEENFFILFGPDLFAKMKEKQQKAHLFGHCLATRTRQVSILQNSFASNLKSDPLW